MEITVESLFKSWEDDDKNRYYPLRCRCGRGECVIVRDGGTGNIRELKTKEIRNSDRLMIQ
jgi:hypothetical protein